ncbi:TOBE domain-containing protein [Curtobacterium sp. Leaf261]|uniref:TOBE domain-containing protein n=1 Tax=Curtobacterium sp. Leaf261 TaxID=1736311 RepID=UPI0006FBC6CA|nr:TOBE domain-containing protein [Curtobacterium sp. Leaf261]KQO62747.1 MerR family transcriptional regulator [Curtobacterium sp. Leaf261]
MTQLRIRDAATYLGVSDDTVRRLVDGGTFTRFADDAGRAVVDGRELAEYGKERATQLADPASAVHSSARNRFVGIVTDVVADRVMAQVELQCGPHRVVSLMSAEAVRDLGLEVGSVAVAVVKATMVVVEAAPVEAAGAAPVVEPEHEGTE